MIISKFIFIAAIKKKHSTFLYSQTVRKIETESDLNFIFRTRERFDWSRESESAICQSCDVT